MKEDRRTPTPTQCQILSIPLSHSHSLSLSLSFCLSFSPFPGKPIKTTFCFFPKEEEQEPPSGCWEAIWFGSLSVRFPRPPWKRMCNFAQCPNHSKCNLFYLFQGATFLETGEGESSTSPAEYRASGMLPFSWKGSWVTSGRLVAHSAIQGRETQRPFNNTRIPRTHSFCTSTWKFPVVDGGARPRLLRDVA